jgi:hypothetical protein
MEEWGRYSRCDIDRVVRKSDGPLEIEEMINMMAKYKNSSIKEVTHYNTG